MSKGQLLAALLDETSNRNMCLILDDVYNNIERSEGSLIISHAASILAPINLAGLGDQEVLAVIMRESQYQHNLKKRLITLKITSQKISKNFPNSTSDEKYFRKQASSY
ncbi:MAG: hypothetical protein HWD61_15105 [Parachlamydiaceae bacterium]|nr:MAG: hypothetical protein HWD61_15105 [Parachlamydiaceae bacterium]